MNRAISGQIFDTTSVAYHLNVRPKMKRVASNSLELVGRNSKWDTHV